MHSSDCSSGGFQHFLFSLYLRMEVYSNNSTKQNCSHNGMLQCPSVSVSLHLLLRFLFTTFFNTKLQNEDNITEHAKCVCNKISRFDCSFIYKNVLTKQPCITSLCICYLKLKVLSLHCVPRYVSIIKISQ